MVKAYNPSVGDIRDLELRKKGKKTRHEGKLTHFPFNLIRYDEFLTSDLMAVVRGSKIQILLYTSLHRRVLDSSCKQSQVELQVVL